MKTESAMPGGGHNTEIDWQDIHCRLEKTRAALEKTAEPSPEEQQTILKKRAGVLAQPPSRAEARENTLDIVEFSLSQEIYGIASALVEEVYPLKDLTELPGTPAFVLGIISVRGKILSVIDLKKFFSLPDKGLGDLNKILILRNETMEFGVLADVILGTRTIERAAIQPAPETVGGIGAKYIKGLTDDNIIVLDAEEILNDEKILVNETVTET